MRYLGGKSKLQYEIAGYLNMVLRPGQTLWIPMFGAGWEAQHIRGSGRKYGSDYNEALITMWVHLLDGWLPPRVFTPEDYERIKAIKDPDDPLTAFAGFAMSFGGKWFGGYARDEFGVVSDRMAERGRLSLQRKVAAMRGWQFFQADFLEVEPPDRNCLIYCDPPYAGTTEYGAVEPFDHEAFWERVRQLEAWGHAVVVSEYNAPADFTELARWYIKTDMRTKDNGNEDRVEKIFRLTRSL